MDRGRAALLIGLVFCVCGTMAADAGDDYEKALDLFASGEYRENVARYRPYSWEARNSPDILQLYCVSLARLGRSDLADAFAAGTPGYVTEYAAGYLNLLSGKAGRAGAIFYKLQERADRLSRLWGNLGLLEMGVVTGNIAGMREPLEKVRAIRKEAEPLGPAAKDVNYYEIYHELSTAQFAAADRLLAERKNDLHRVRYAELKLAVLLRADLFDEAKALFRELRASERSLDSLSVLWARLLRNMSGDVAYRSYLVERSRRPPSSAAVRIELAVMDLSSSSPAEKAAGVEELQKLSGEYPHDAALQLAVANYFLEHGTVKEPLRSLLKLPEEPLNFILYHVVRAKALYARDIKAAMSSFHRAKAMDAYHPEVLQLEYSLAMRQGDLKAARSVLLKSLRVEPNAPDTLLSLAEIYKDEKNAIGLITARQQVRELKRVVVPEIGEQIDAMVAELCASFEARELPSACR